jgi:hypothetical protein
MTTGLLKKSPASRPAARGPRFCLDALGNDLGDRGIGRDVDLVF